MVSCILLAAGESKRFGSPKALAKLNTETVIEHIQKTLALSRLAQIIIVLGADNDKIKSFILKNKKIKTVINKNFKQGQTSSFKVGLKALSPKTKGIMLLPVDLPLIKKETLDSLIDFFLDRKPKILIPTYQGRYAHPPIFNASLIAELSNLEDSSPLFEIQHKHNESTLIFPADDFGVALSFNTKSEFEKIKEIFNQPESRWKPHGQARGTCIYP